MCLEVETERAVDVTQPIHQGVENTAELQRRDRRLERQETELQKTGRPRPLVCRILRRFTQATFKLIRWLCALSTGIVPPRWRKPCSSCAPSAPNFNRSNRTPMGNKGAGRSLVRRYHLYSHAAGLHVSGGSDGLVEPLRARWPRGGGPRASQTRTRARSSPARLTSRRWNLKWTPNVGPLHNPSCA